MSTATDQQTVAELYAQALLDLAASEGVAEAIDQELSEFVAYLRIENDFRTFFESQVIDGDARRDSLEKMLRNNMSDLLLNTLQILNRRGRTDIVVDMQAIYHQLFMKSQGIREAQVTSATPLTEAARSQVQQLLEKHTGSKINLVEHVEASLLGGLVIRVGDERVDASVARQLRRFHDILLDHASRNIHAGTERFFEGKTAE